MCTVQTALHLPTTYSSSTGSQGNPKGAEAQETHRVKTTNQLVSGAHDSVNPGAKNVGSCLTLLQKTEEHSNTIGTAPA